MEVKLIIVNYVCIFWLFAVSMATSKSTQEEKTYQKIGQLIEQAVKLALQKEIVGEAYYPAASCKEIAKLRPGLPPGYYWIKASNDSIVQAYCDGAWTRIAFLNMSDPTHHCPSTWKEITHPIRTCTKKYRTYYCDSVIYPTQGIRYNKVRGRIIGYQHGRTYAFSYYNQFKNTTTIDTYYLDGIAITYGSPRKHIWSFAASLCEGCRFCPCTNNTYANYVAPPWVGDSFFCESGTPTVPRPPFPEDLFFEEDPLWDGKGCENGEICCKFNDPPWFVKELNETTNADVEVRNCGTINSTQDVPVELIEVYIQ